MWPNFIKHGRCQNFFKNIPICDDSIWNIYRIVVRVLLGFFLLIFLNTSFFRDESPGQGQHRRESDSAGEALECVHAGLRAG